MVSLPRSSLIYLVRWPAVRQNLARRDEGSGRSSTATPYLIAWQTGYPSNLSEGAGATARSASTGKPLLDVGLKARGPRGREQGSVNSRGRIVWIAYEVKTGTMKFFKESEKQLHGYLRAVRAPQVRRLRAGNIPETGRHVMAVQASPSQSWAPSP
jgi:hypothetical protein